MNLIDMHCDTLAELRYAQQAGKPKSFLHNDLMMDLERMKQGDYLLQVYGLLCSPGPEREKKPPAGLPGRNRHFLPPAGTVSR